MNRKEVNASSPLRILEASMRGGLGAGHLGVIMSRAGVGKTACLIQMALDDLMREREVLHIAIGQQLDHVRAWYDALFDDLARHTDLQDRGRVQATVARHRIIQAYPDTPFDATQLDELLARLSEHLSFSPKTILIDDFDWSVAGDQVSDLLAAFRSAAARIGAELWLTAQTHRDTTGERPNALVAPCAAHADLIDVAIFLEPAGDCAEVRLLKDYDSATLPATTLRLHPDSMRLARANETPLTGAPRTLLSGGAEGAEAAFGANAEQWGVREVNFTFAGREVVRRRGLRVLSDEELQAGHVQDAYVRAHLRRDFPITDDFRKVLQSIWHQVNAAGQVFAIGEIQADGTVTGGTGWGVELARHWRKPVFVFDQSKGAWFSWCDGAWEQAKAPVIDRSRFCGTGTRALTKAGRKAIAELFARSFGRAQ